MSQPIELIELEDYERSKRQAYARAHQKDAPSGIKCPNCGAELLIDNSWTLASMPPRKSVRCSECKFQTTVTA